jgi:hypothetical protein
MSIGLAEVTSPPRVWSYAFEGDWENDPFPSGSSDIDMLSTGEITSISVSGDGTSWESESGVLLVPEPSQTSAMLAGVALLAHLERRRRRLRTGG